MLPAMDISAVLAAHDAQVRRSLDAAPGFVAEDTGLVVRVTAPEGSDRSFVEWSGLDERTVDVAIAENLTHFAGRAFEWKTYGRDKPADLGEWLTAAGFVAGDPEAFVVGELADVLAATAGHEEVDGVDIRDALDTDLPSMLTLARAVWGKDASGMFSELFARREHDPAQLSILVAVADAIVVCSGWVELPRDADFASLWGGSTLGSSRGRGIYRALVRRRTLLAQVSGHHWLQVDCTPASRVILERLGLRQLDTTMPYRWRPVTAPAAAR